MTPIIKGQDKIYVWSRGNVCINRGVLLLHCSPVRVVSSAKGLFGRDCTIPQASRSSTHRGLTLKMYVCRIKTSFSSIKVLDAGGDFFSNRQLCSRVWGLLVK
jgi:hypothetical protein